MATPATVATRVARREEAGGVGAEDRAPATRRGGIARPAARRARPAPACASRQVAGSGRGELVPQRLVAPDHGAGAKTLADLEPAGGAHRQASRLVGDQRAQVIGELLACRSPRSAPGSAARRWDPSRRRAPRADPPRTTACRRAGRRRRRRRDPCSRRSARRRPAGPWPSASRMLRPKVSCVLSASETTMSAAASRSGFTRAMKLACTRVCARTP